MEYLRDCFEPLGYVFGASAVYRCTRRVTEERIDAFAALGLDERRALMERAVDSAPRSVAQVLRCGLARMLAQYDRIGALAALAHVELGIGHPDPSQDFSAIAASNREIVAGLLET